MVLIAAEKRTDCIADIAILDERAAVEDYGRVGGVHLEKAAVEFAAGLQRHDALAVVRRRELRPLGGRNGHLRLARGIAASDNEVRCAIAIRRHKEVAIAGERTFVEHNLGRSAAFSNPDLSVSRVGSAVYDKTCILVAGVCEAQAPRCLVDTVRGIGRIPDDGIEHLCRIA